jgi:hypothetical protein
MPTLNAELNPLAAPLQIRCGISSGEVELEPGARLGSVHGVVPDRAVALRLHAGPDELVLGEEAGQGALHELDRLEALEDPVAGERAFVWRPTVPPPPT